MEYKCLNNQIFSNGRYALVPIRFEDRYNIMQWRNEQIYHLRQAEPLTKEKQDWYFENVVANLFEQEQPNQILFSFLENNVCIGYGGLVHINWIDKNAEISFIMNTGLEAKFFVSNWVKYLALIEQVAFQELSLHKIYTYAFDLRPNLYTALKQARFKEDARLSEHILMNDKYIDVLIHSKLNTTLSLRLANSEDENITYSWANNEMVRKFSFNKNFLKREEHNHWFKIKINSKDCIYFIAESEGNVVGSFRADKEEKEIVISFLLDPKYHGKGLGYKLLQSGVIKVKEFWPNELLSGFVMSENISSATLFRLLDFKEEVLENGTLKFTTSS